LLIIIWYFFHNYFWPRPRPHSPGLGLEVLASFNITGLATTYGQLWVCQNSGIYPSQSQGHSLRRTVQKIIWR